MRIFQSFPRDPSVKSGVPWQKLIPGTLFFSRLAKRKAYKLIVVYKLMDFILFFFWEGKWMRRKRGTGENLLLSVACFDKALSHLILPVTPILKYYNSILKT